MDHTKNWAFLGSIGAAIIAGVYVLWGPSERKRSKRSEKCPGLVNLGNTCFLNAVLQGFAGSQSFIQWLGDFIDRSDEGKNSSCLAWTLSKVMKVLNNESLDHDDEGDPYSPVEVIDALRMRRWVISSDEQDAHELFHVLTQTLDEEAAKSPSVFSLLDVADLDRKEPTLTGAVSRTRAALSALPSKHMEHPFKGRLASQLQCKLCGYKSPVKHDTFDSLSLTIPSKDFWGSLSLEGLLRHFISSETVQNVECEGCAKRQKEHGQDKGGGTPRTTFTKKMTIGKLPECLCVHIQRTVWLNNGMPTKRFDHISFPETLHMDEYVYQKRKDSVSELDKIKLLGGKVKNGEKPPVPKVPAKLRQSVTKQMTLLQALNYQPRQGMNGILGPAVAYSRANGHSPQLSNGHAPIPKEDVPSQNKTNPIATSPIFSSSNGFSASSALQNANLSLLLNRNELDKRSDCKYKLMSVLVHHGDALSGHFITYRRAPPPLGQRFSDRWLYTSDSEVHSVRLRDVLDSNAYMLFYEKF